MLYTAFNQLVDDEDSMVESSNAAKSVLGRRLTLSVWETHLEWREIRLGLARPFLFCRYQGFSISGLVESRIFSQVVHRLQSAVPNRLTFADWICKTRMLATDPTFTPTQAQRALPRGLRVSSAQGLCSSTTKSPTPRRLPSGLRF